MSTSTGLSLLVTESDASWSDMVESLAKESQDSTFGNDDITMLECWTPCDYEGCGGGGC